MELVAIGDRERAPHGPNSYWITPRAAIMPSTLVHVGFAALIASALLSDHFDGRAVLVVFAAAAVPDLDSFLGLWIIGGHRTILHNLVLPGVAIVVIWWDTRWRATSTLRMRWGERGIRVLWVGVIGGWIVAQVLLDAFFNGANLLWPLHDEFIDLSGHLIVSDQRGLVQTFLNLEWTDGGLAINPSDSRGTSADTHYYTGVDPGPDAPADVERWFPLADSGPLFLVAMCGYVAVGFRLWERRVRSSERG